MVTIVAPGYVQCYECGHPANMQKEDENESKRDPRSKEYYICYIYKCVNCGTETLRCFQPD